MKTHSVIARVPGKVMLGGEYAVLRGGMSLACTVDRWLEAEVLPTPERGRGLWIESNLWPSARLLTHIEPEEIAAEPLLQAAASIVGNAQGEGLTLRVRSDLDVAFGLGSSSAVRLAALMALEAFFRPEVDRSEALARMVWQQQRAEQKFASGYDVHTQLRGGLIAWRPDYSDWPGASSRLPSLGLARWVHIFVGGTGAPTAALGRSVSSWLRASEQEVHFDQLSELLVEDMMQLLRWNSLEGMPAVAASVARHRAVLAAAPGFPLGLASALTALPGCDQQWTFKTTGAGGEDALLLLGEQQELGPAFAALAARGWRPLDAEFCEAGASWRHAQESV